VRKAGFTGAPEPLGIDELGRERVSYIPGQVSNYPLSAAAASHEALISAAALLRRYHDATASFLEQPRAHDGWRLPPRAPSEVVCHGDFAPYNVVLAGTQAVGIIDFDTAHPAPRAWDVAYALYRWAPLTNPSNRDGFGTIEQQLARATAFCDAYGISRTERDGLSQLVIERLQALVAFMTAEASRGDTAFESNVRDGHHVLYLDDIAYVRAHAERIERALAGR
jgi:Ser/Thr protein kinase RdoA (MazF antagonist)